MFLVPTQLGRSSIHGIGVFATNDIPAGTKVWEFTEGVDWRISVDDFDRFPEPFLSQLRHWCYKEPEGDYILCGDNAKFMNHSESPNCDDNGTSWTITNRDIAAGEELTCDYREFDADWQNDPLHGG